MPKMTFIVRGGVRKEVDAPVGFSVLDIAHRNDVDIEGACEGQMACSTCHVIVDEEWSGRLPPPCEEEEDMLDLAFHVTRHSRLACQIWTSDALNSLTVRMPGGSHDMQGR